MIKIIGGTKKGILLNVPRNNLVRPTSALKRKSIFDILTSKLLKQNNQNNLRNKIILDAFAGTGVLGLESLSRGGKYCYFVEKNIHNIKYLNNNCKKIFLKNNYKIIKSDFLEIDTKKFYKNNKIDLIFLDPPYNFVKHELIINKIYDLNICKINTILVLETSHLFTWPRIKFLEIFDERILGNTKISFANLI